MIVDLVQSIERAHTGPASPVTFSPAVRAGIQVDVRKLIRHTSNGTTPYFFEARKRYPDDTAFFVSGWIMTAQDAIGGIVNLGAGIADADFKSVSQASVLGVIEFEDRAVGLLEEHGYESEAYASMEFVNYENEGRRVLKAGGGGCWRHKRAAP